MKTGNYENTVEVCCHRVSIRYWNFPKRILTDEVKSLLDDEGERRAKDCIIDGYSSGQLNCLYDETEFQGWWEIES